MTPRESQTDETGYEVLAPLASGTYGENLVAVRRDPYGLGKLFVLRQLRRGLSSDAEVRAAFVEIGKRAVRLSHPNVVQTFELGQRGGALFAVTEYLEGEPLDAVMAAVAPAPGAVDPRLWLLIACEALNGLHYAHELRDFDGSKLGLVHGGITPRKIFVTYAGRVVVTDFGMAALAAHAKRVEGTFLPEMVSYAAPEQRSGKACNARADVYAIGLILWELLSGRRHRHPADPTVELEELPHLREIKPDLDFKLADVVMRAVELDPEARFASAAAMRAALEPFVDRGGTVRRSALGDAIAALFAKTRDKIPALLSKRAAPLEPQDPHAITLGGEAAAPAQEEEEEEEAFLLGSPIEAVSEANVISVTELVSDSELLSSVEMIGSGPASDDGDAPDSAMPVSLSEVEIPEQTPPSAKRSDRPSSRRASSRPPTSARDATTVKTPSARPAAPEKERESGRPEPEERSSEMAAAPKSEPEPEAPTPREPKSPDSGERPTLAHEQVWEEAKGPSPKKADDDDKSAPASSKPVVSTPRLDDEPSERDIDGDSTPSR